MTCYHQNICDIRLERQHNLLFVGDHMFEVDNTHYFAATISYRSLAL